jgi:hypothetical protein
MGCLSVTRLPLVLVCAGFSILAGTGRPTAQAQTTVAVTGRSASNPTQEPAAPPPVILPDSVTAGDEPQAPGPAIPHPPAFGPDLPPTQTTTGPLDVICESIFGEASVEDWQPLSLSTFFTDGWDRPYVKSPEGTNGAPKQNWFGAADGIFSRLGALEFFYTNGMTKNIGLLLNPFPWSPDKPSTNGNQYWASYNLYLPLNQRLELLVVVPFVASNKTSSTGHYIANFGDLTISERFRLVEQRNFALQALLTERTPTGQSINGNDINYITPSVEFWCNFAPKWVLRGGKGINIDTGRTSVTDTYFTNVAMGRYLTTKDAPVFKSLVAHVVVSTMSDVLGRKDHITEVYVAPGVRFGLDSDHKWSVLTAIQTPVAGPHPYAYQLNLGLSRNY